MDIESSVRKVAKSLGRPAEELHEIVHQGSINRVFSVDDLIVRLDHDRSPEEALAEYRKEEWCAAWVAGRGVVVPEVLDVGMLDGRAYIAMKRIEGRWGGDSALDPLMTYRKLGEITSRLGVIPEPGDPQPFFDGSGESEWLKILHRNVDALTCDDPLLGLGVYEMSEQDRLRGVFRDLLAFPFVYGLCHGDYSPHNILLLPDGDAALIDWGCAWLGPVPHGDMIETVRNHLVWNDPTAEGLEAFLDGYGPAAREAMIIQNDVVLVKAFDLVRWAIDRRPPRIGELAERATLLRKSILS